MHRLVYPTYQHRTPRAGGWRVVDGREGDAMSLPIRGRSWGSPEQAFEVAKRRGAKRLDFLKAYAGNLWRDCNALGIRADVAWGQADVETGNRQTGIGFQSDRWVKEGNPSGLGVVDNLPDGTPVHTFTPESAARIHATHLAGYAGIAPPVDWVELDFRWGDMLRAGYYGVATTTDDLSGRWATGKDYGPKIEARWALYGFSEPTVDIPPDAGGGGTDVATKPKIIQGYTPKIIDKWIHVTQDGYTGVQRFIRNRNGQKIRVLKWHVMEGTMWGSWIHAHAVKASWTVQIGKDGAIWRTVPEQHGPWTNGDVNKPSQQMVSIMNRYGWDPNVYTLSVEHEGKSGGLPYTDAQLKASVWQAWDWITRYGEDLVVLVPLGHYETNSVHRPNCPDPASEGHPFIAQMKRHLGDRVADHDVIIGDDKLWPVRLDDGTVWDGVHDVIVTSGAQPVKFFADTRTVTVTAAVLNSRQWASTAANLTRHAKENGEAIDVLGAVEGEVVSDEGRWWVDALGNRYWSGGTAEKPDMTWNSPEHPGDPEPPDDEPHLPDYGNHVGKVPQVVNGTLYYEFWDDEDPAPGHVKTAIDSGNLRKWAGVGEAVGTVQEGDAVRVTHYVYGEPVEYDGGGMENMWYIVDPGDGRDPILHGARVWAGLFNERPH